MSTNGFTQSLGSQGFVFVNVQVLEFSTTFLMSTSVSLYKLIVIYGHDYDLNPLNYFYLMLMLLPYSLLEKIILFFF